ncbi:hypothetical protein PVK06_047378 [Gossypium arboreum]|uniref:RNase H type-1 domain-containing protein n=1 Tax=Gossypium arboreum TaxID=29729 RepID=A0ABR0MD63_GOSAR|nr:hypothetical protein PVK06_047378 [Gossypium arboreum]
MSGLTLVERSRWLSHRRPPCTVDGTPKATDFLVINKGMVDVAWTWGGNKSRGVLDGLTLLRNMSYDGVRIQSDSMEVVKAIQDFSQTSSNSALFRRIQHMLLNVRSWVI